MRPRFPLAAKILLWFFLNLLVLVGVALLGFRVQFRFGLDLLIAGRGGERIQGLANGIAAELGARPREEWNDILARFASGYGVGFSLYRPDGGYVAGEATGIPREVHERLRDQAGVVAPRFNGRLPADAEVRPPGNPAFQIDSQPAPLPAAANAPDAAQAPRTTQMDAAGNPLPQPPQPRAPLRGERQRFDRARTPGLPLPPVPRPRFMLRAGEPPQYWVGVPLPTFDPLRPQGRMTLLTRSDSLSGGGLFFDYFPWLLGGGAVVGLSVLFWLPLVRGITRALTQLTRATGEIAEGRFETRVPESRKDELGALAGAVNRMAARLAGFVTGQKRFLGDTAHELCAPIARMQMALGILEQRADEKQRPYVNDVREELQHISALVNELLSFSKAGLRAQPAALQAVVVAEIAHRVAEREGKGGGVVEVSVAADLRARAEPELLARALANLVRNALRYAGGTVRLTATATADQILITVSDAGPGVPEAALQKIFDPFYRLEESRSRETGGVGLGLAIVKTCVEACDGSVSAHNRQPSGLEVRLTLRAA